MKKFILITVLFVALMVSCQRHGSGGYTGGHESSRNFFAKTTVHDKTIQSFYFYIEDHEHPRGGAVVEIAPAKEKEADRYKMSLYYFGPGIAQDDSTYELMLNEDNMNAIGTALADSGLLELNGITDFTRAIPPDSGTYVLRANFVSGEKYNFEVNGGFSDEIYLQSYDWMEIIWSYLEDAGMDMTEMKEIYDGASNVLEENEEMDEDDFPTGEEHE